MVNRGGENGGDGPRAVFQPAGAYSGRGRRFACLRCVCLTTGEDFLAVATLDDDGRPRAALLDCPACGYEHRALPAATALDCDLIDQDEFEFLCSPIELADSLGNETLRVKRK